MNYSELIALSEETRKICIWGTGFFGSGDAYLFIKCMIEPKKISFFCDNKNIVDVEITDGVKTVDRTYIYEHKDEVVCIIAVENIEVQKVIKKQLADEGILAYTLNSSDIFQLADSMLGGGILRGLLKNF
jgi:hypothetical protein